MSVNKAILMGNVGQEPNIKTFENGGMVAQLTLATTKKGFTTKDGKTIPDHTEWHNIVLTNGLAKIASQYVKKGDKLYIEGELRTRNYDDKNGVKHFITEIYGDKLELLTPKQNNVQQNAPAPNLDNVPF